jgi:hypothetical protein
MSYLWETGTGIKYREQVDVRKKGRKRVADREGQFISEEERDIVSKQRRYRLSLLRRSTN